MESGFYVDYSVKGTAKCKSCKKVIVKDELRIGKSVLYKDQAYLQYHHVSCILRKFHNARIASNVVTDAESLIGFADLRGDDQLQLRNLIAHENGMRNKTLPSSLQKRKARVSPEAPIHVRKARLKSSNSETLTVLFTNADQLTTTKMAELRLRIQQEKPLVVAICEVKPKNSQERHDYDLPFFSLHPVNIHDPIGRGIAVYTHSSLDQSVVQINSNLGFQEACLLEIKLRGGDLMLFGCMYRSPSLSSTSDKNNKCLNRLLQNIANTKYTHRCIVGDFNFRDINWASWSTCHNDESKEQKFIETVRDCFLYQHNAENSRRRGNDQPSLIDLIFTDELMQVSDVQHQAPLGKSDHNVISFKFNCYLDYAKPREKFLYDKGDFDAMRGQLTEEKWMEEFVATANDKSVENMWR